MFKKQKIKFCRFQLLHTTVTEIRRPLQAPCGYKVRYLKSLSRAVHTPVFSFLRPNSQEHSAWPYTNHVSFLSRTAMSFSLDRFGFDDGGSLCKFFNSGMRWRRFLVSSSTVEKISHTEVAVHTASMFQMERLRRSSIHDCQRSWEMQRPMYANARLVSSISRP